MLELGCTVLFLWILSCAKIHLKELTDDKTKREEMGMVYIDIVTNVSIIMIKNEMKRKNEEWENVMCDESLQHYLYDYRISL